MNFDFWRVHLYILINFFNTRVHALGNLFTMILSNRLWGVKPSDSKNFLDAMFSTIKLAQTNVYSAWYIFFVKDRITSWPYPRRRWLSKNIEPTQSQYWKMSCPGNQLIIFFFKKTPTDPSHNIFHTYKMIETAQHDQRRFQHDIFPDFLCRFLLKCDGSSTLITRFLPNV